MDIDLQKLTLKQLKEKLTKHNLDTTGKKAELISRLQTCLSESTQMGEGKKPDEPEGDKELPESMEGHTEGTSSLPLDGDNLEEDDIAEEAVDMDDDADIEEDAILGDSDLEEAEDEMAEDGGDIEETEAEQQELENEEMEEEEEDAEQDNSELTTDDVKADTEENGEASKDKPSDTNKGSSTEKKESSWIKIVQLSKIRGKFRSMESVKLVCQQTRLTDTARDKQRVKAYPISVATLSNPDFVDLTKECVSVQINFAKSVKTAEVGSGLEGIVTFNFQKKNNIDDFVAKLKTLVEDLEVSVAPESGAKGIPGTIGQFIQGFKRHCKGHDQGYEDSTLLIPELPSTITEEMLWEMFPTAWEIFLFPPVERDPKTKQPGRKERFATVYFPDIDTSRKATSKLGSRPPMHGFSKLEVIPLKFLNRDTLTSGKPGQFAARNPRYAGRSSSVQNRNAPRNTSTYAGPASAEHRAKYSHQQNPRARQTHRGPLLPSPMAAQGRSQGHQRSPLLSNRGAQLSSHDNYPSRRSQDPFQQRGRNFNPHSNFPSAQRDTGSSSQHNEGLQVLGNLLTSLGGQRSADAAAYLLQELAGPQQQGEPRQRMAPKRPLSPGMSNQNKRRNFSGSRPIDPGMNRRHQDDFYRSPDHHALGGYGDTSPRHARGGRRPIAQASASHSQASSEGVYDSLNVVSRIVRASKELKDALKKDDHGYGGGYSDNYKEYQQEQPYDYQYGSHY